MNCLDASQNEHVAVARLVFELQWQLGSSWDTPYRALEIYRRLKLLRNEHALGKTALGILVAVAYVLAHKFSSVPMISTSEVVLEVARLYNIECSADAACTAEATAFRLLGWQIPPIDDTLGGIIQSTCAAAPDVERVHVHNIARGLLCSANTPQRFRLSNALLATVCCTSASLADAQRAVVALAGFEIYENRRKRARTETPPPSSHSQSRQNCPTAGPLPCA